MAHGPDVDLQLDPVIHQRIQDADEHAHNSATGSVPRATTGNANDSRDAFGTSAFTINIHQPLPNEDKVQFISHVKHRRTNSAQNDIHVISQHRQHDYGNHAQSTNVPIQSKLH